MTTILSRSLFGLTPSEVRISAEPAPTLQISGLTEGATREARIRVASALASLEIRHGAKVTIDPPQEGSAAQLDLAIAAAVLGAHGLLSSKVGPDLVLLGELSLAGDLRPIRGVTPLLADHSPAIVPEENAGEAARCNAFTIASLRELMAGDFRTWDPIIAPTSAHSPGIVLVGAPGSGKTLIARQLATSIGFVPSRDVDAIYSAAGLLPPDEGYVSWCPFRAPHHSVSEVGLVGGGSNPRPGEVSLAHRGILFLDELTEFRSSALDCLFSALKAGRSEISRKGQRCSFPARPALVVGAAENSPRLARIIERFGLLPVPIENHWTLARAIDQARRVPS